MGRQGNLEAVLFCSSSALWALLSDKLGTLDTLLVCILRFQSCCLLINIRSAADVRHSTDSQLVTELAALGQAGAARQSRACWR